jgi:O-antigen/teichoic acid export membrane protein
MKAQLLRLLKGTFIYGGGSIISRVIAFLLLPLTTAYLLPEDYGIIGTLAMAPQIFSGLFTLGFGVSLSRCYWSEKEEGDRPGMIWVSFIAIFANIVFWVLLGACFSKSISTLLLGSNQYAYLVFLTLVSLGLNAATLPFLTYLKLQERAKLVAGLTVLETTISIGSMIFFVVFLNRHAQGFIEAGVIGQIVNFLCFFGIGLFELRLAFKWNYLRELLVIGYPYMFGLIGYFLMQCSSRYILQLHSNLDDVGLFFLGLSLARPIDFVVGGFISAWPPFFTSFMHKQEEGARLFSKILSYYVIAISCLLALFFALAKPVVLTMVHPRYNEVWRVVGILATALALWGVYSISATGFIFYKKSLWQMLTEIGAGLFSIVSCFLLIPIFQKEGAAIAMLLSFLALAVASFLLNLRLFPIQYETKRLFKVTGGLLMVAIVSFLPIEPLSVYCGWMMMTTLVFFLYIWFFCLASEEKKYFQFSFSTGH